MNKTLFAAMMAIAALSACSDPKEANNENFQAALQKGFDEGKANFSSGVCVPIDLGGIAFDEASLSAKVRSDPLYMPLNPYETQQRLEVLAKVGLLAPQSGGESVYQVTEKGKPLLRKVSRAIYGNYFAFCTGKFSIQVTAFSEPVNDGQRTYSEVRYHSVLQEPELWVNHQELRTVFANFLEQKPASATVYLTDEGWVMQERSDQ